MALSDHALTTVQAVKDHLAGKVTVPTEHDAMLEVIVNAVSEEIEGDCGRHFETAARTETYSGRGDYRLRLKNRPVTAVTSVKVGTVTVTDYTTESESGILVRKDGDKIGTWPLGVRNIEVTYTAGYVLPKAASGRTLPWAVELAALLLAAAEYTLRDKAGLRGETFEGLTLTFDRWPENVRRLLAPYRVVRSA